MLHVIITRALSAVDFVDACKLRALLLLFVEIINKSITHRHHHREKL